MKVKCRICPHGCILDEGQIGFCKARMNVNGEIICKNYAKLTSIALDPIEKTAALPIELVVSSQQAVGATLGEDAVAIGMKAIILGFALVVLIMVAYYNVSGLVADLALLLNLFIMLSVLSAFNFTVTLTSIAGLILTLGMAVDTNVIIYERIKEERRAGKSDVAAVKAGFDKAFWTVMDANITTIIAALVLSQLGSSSVKGFANTLAIGIVSSVFTALFVSHLVFDAAITDREGKKLLISWRKN